MISTSGAKTYSAGRITATSPGQTTTATPASPPGAAPIAPDDRRTSILSYTTTGVFLTESRTPRGPREAPVPTAAPADSTRWIRHPALAHKLSAAVELLLQSVLLMLEDDFPFSASLEGGGFYTCEQTGLDFGWAPLIETETARLVTEAATDVSPGLFAPELPALLTAVDAQPVPVQQALIRKAAARHLTRPVVPTPEQISVQAHATAARPGVTPLTAARGPRR